MNDHGKRRDPAARIRSLPDTAAAPFSVPAIRQPPPFWRAAAALVQRARRVWPLPAVEPDDFWLDVRRQLLELPQMRAAAPEASSGPAAAFGRRSPDPSSWGPQDSARLTGRPPIRSQWLIKAGRYVRMSAPDGHDWFIAAALIAFFALGYVAAMASGSMAS
jgi:hypothetical protein